MPIFLETKRLILKTPEPSHLDDLIALRSEPEVMKYVGNGQIQTKEQVQQFLEVAIEYQKSMDLVFVLSMKKKREILLDKQGYFT